MKIPDSVVSFKDGTKPDDRYRKFEKSKKLMYGYKNEPMHVLLWHLWPSYDFIFAVPTKKNRYYKEEYAFFTYRDVRKKQKICAFYVDFDELRILKDGFNRLYRAAVERKKSGGIQNLASRRNP